MFAILGSGLALISSLLPMPHVLHMCNLILIFKGAYSQKFALSFRVDSELGLLGNTGTLKTMRTLGCIFYCEMNMSFWGIGREYYGLSMVNPSKAPVSMHEYSEVK